MHVSPSKPSSATCKRSPKKDEDETYTAEEIDDLNERFEKAANRQIASKNSVVKLTATERDLLQVAEIIRDKLVIAVAGEKGLLAEVFGGDCSRFHRFQLVLDQVQLSEMHASDQRWRHVSEHIAIIEDVLKELGLYKPWVPKKKAPESLKYLGVRSRLTPGDMVVLRPEFDDCENLAFSVEPALPAGLELSSATGEISGKLEPGLQVAMQTYKVTVRNDGGATSFDLEFAVAPMAPGTIAYPSWVELIHVGEAVRLEPEMDGGHSKDWSIEPELPSGLTFSASTGTIAGLALSPSALSAYLVTAANLSGKVNTTLQLCVSIPQPMSLVYPDLQEELLVGGMVFLRPDVALETSAAQRVGRRLWNLARMRMLKRLHLQAMPNMEFSVEPDLPQGLVLGRRTGVITGVPEAKSDSVTHTVTASNDGGSATVEVSFAVRLYAPRDLAYTQVEARYFTGQEVNIMPEVKGIVEHWEVAPALPPGLQLHARKGVISGVMPHEVLPEASWTVTAKNSEGDSSTAITFSVVLAPPTGLAYATLAKEFPFSALPLLRPVSLTPTVEGQVASFSVEPALPSGLALDPETGVLSGTATETTDKATYEVTASNETGSTRLALSLSVKQTRPEGLAYPAVEQVYSVGEEVNLEPVVLGGATLWAVEPSLPDGLQLNAETGNIHGTPQDPSIATTYVITASNEAGGTSLEWRFAVTELAPEGLSYPTSSTEYSVGQEVHVAPQLSMGSCVRFAAEPELPEGLYLDPTTGVISGTPSAEAGAETYVITGTSKSGESCSVELAFACLEPVHEVTGVSQRFAEAIDEITEVADMREEPNKGKVLGDWMVWMVHRVHLNDPSLTELCFNNLWMPPGHQEERIAPKLMKAIAHNTNLTSLQLAHSNLGKPEGHLLAESLKSNTTLQIVNVESNSLDSDAIRHIAQALHETPGSVIETWRFNNQKHIGQYFGRPVEETIGEMMEKNTRICKLGFACNDANWRLVIDRAILRNMDFARRRRKGGDGPAEEDELAPEEKPLSRVILTNAPDKKLSEVFGQDERLALVRKHIFENKVLPKHEVMQAWAKGQGKPLPYSAVKPLLEDVRSRLLDAAKNQTVGVWDAYGAEFSGTMRAWSVDGANWLVDVWPSSRQRFHFTSDKQPTIEVAGSFREWLQPPAP